MGFLREAFGNHKAEVWKQLSEQIGARFIAGGFWHADKVVAKVDAWTVTLDTYCEPVGRTTVTCTRMRAPYVNRDGFRFTIYKMDVFSDLARHAGMQDIPIGDAAFDHDYIIKANDEAKARALFADETLRRIITELPEFHLEVKDDEGWFGEHFPEGVDELSFQVVGVIEDIATLTKLYDLFAETLHQLCRIGSAYEGEIGAA